MAMYITAFASISSVAVEVEALSIQKEKKRTLRTQVKCDVKIVKGAVSRQSSSFCLILPITRPKSLWNLK